MIFDQKWYYDVCETTITTNTVFGFVSSSEYYVGKLLFNTLKERKKKDRVIFILIVVTLSFCLIF